MPQATIDAQAIAQLELDQYISEQAIAVVCPQEDLLDKAFDELTPSEWEQLKQYQPEIEIDSFGTLYRVWHGMNFDSIVIRKRRFCDAHSLKKLNPPCLLTEAGLLS